MNRSSRNALAGTFALAVVLGGVAPATAAASPVDSRSAHDHVAQAKKGEHAKNDKQAKTDRKLGNAQRKLSREAARKDAFLARAATRNAVSRLDDAVEAPLRANIEADRVLLQGLAISVAAAGSEELKQLATELRGLRPERYNTIINQLRRATRLQAGLIAEEPPVEEPPVEGPATNDSAEAAAALEALVAKLVTFTAATPRAELRAAQRELSAIEKLLDTDEDVPVAEEPVEEEPVEEEPVEEEPATTP